MQSQYLEQNITADDFDARISYSNDTLFTTPNPSNSATAAQNAQYFDGTYHATSVVNASLSYSFQGTSLYVYSASGPSYGSVALITDGNTTTVSAYAEQNVTLPYLLYSVDGLEMGTTHNFTMTNLGDVDNHGGSTMLLDFIKTTVQLAPAGATVTNTTIEDSNSTALTYSGVWGNNTSPLFSGNTSHFTNDSTASVSFSFYGTAFHVYGDQNNDHGAFEVEVDGVTEELRIPLGCGGLFRGGYCEKTDPGAQYFKGYLGPELHNVTIRNTLLDRFNYSYFDLDRIVYTTPSEYLPADITTLSNMNATAVGAVAAAASSPVTGSIGMASSAYSRFDAAQGSGFFGVAALAAVVGHLLGF